MIDQQQVQDAKQALGKKLASWRLTRGLTQLDLAERVPASRSTIAGVERGQQVVDQTFWSRCDALLHAGGKLIAAYDDYQRLHQRYQVDKAEAARRARWGDAGEWPAPTSNPAPRDPRTVTTGDEIERIAGDRTGVASDDMRRRTLVKWGITVTAVAGLSGERPMAFQQPGKVGASDVARLQHAAKRLYSLDYRHGGDSLWQAAAAKVGDGYAMLEHCSYTGTVEEELLKATARVQMCAGWLAFDAGEQTVARTCFTDALALARQARDQEVEAATLAYLAFQANALDRPREAFRFASAAEDVSTVGGPPRLAAIPQLRQAIASALMADHRGTEKALAHARNVLDRDGDKPTTEWCSFLSTAELDGVEGTCAVELGKADRAENLFEKAIAGYGDRYARNRALYRVRLARARLIAGAPDGAAEAASAALDDLDGEVASWRVNSELDNVAQRLAAYPQVPEAATFLTRYPPVAAHR